MLQKKCVRTWFLAVFLAHTFLISRDAAAQDPIRVESDEVLVPTVVFDKELYARLNKQERHHRNSYGQLVAKDAKLWNDIVVKNLTAKDFHLFEDNQEQKIQSVKFEPPAFRVVEDNLGKHPEIVGSGGGLWAYPDVPTTDLSVWLAWPQYVLAYVPSKSAVGSCHQIQVKVERAKLTVWTRSEYCNTAHPASDPLNGTEFGNRLEKAANSKTSNSIDLKLKVAAFADANGARIYVTEGFPQESLQHEFLDGTLYATIGSLVMVYRKNGTLVTRYSDFACCDYGDKERSKDTQNVPETWARGQSSVPYYEKLSASSATEARALLPDRHETQFSLPPGEYVVQAVISDGVYFGIQEGTVTVERYDRGNLSVSDLVVSRRVRKLPQSTSEAAEQVADRYSPLVSKGVEFTPAVDTGFFRGDMLFAYFEINDPLASTRPGAKIFANLRIVDCNSGFVSETFEAVDTATYTTAGSPVIGVGRGVMLNHLLPGAYRLEVQASNADGHTTEWRSADFTVMEAPPLQLSGSTSPKGKREEVILNVTALDADNRPVTDLTTADFQIFEDEKRQAITSVKMTSERITPEAPTPIVILFDLLNTIPRQREYIASRIIKVLEPLEQDEGIYLYLLTNQGALYPVRPRGNMQAAAIAQGSVGAAPGADPTEGPPWTKEIRTLLNHAIDEVHGFRLMDFKDVGMRAVTTFNRLGQIEGEMAYVRGPKTILWITSGVPNSIAYPTGGCKDQTFCGVSESYLAGKCGWECYPSLSDTKCLDYMPFFQHFGAEAVASNTTVSSVAVTDSGLQNFGRGTPANTLQQLAELTGGRVYVSQNSEVEQAIREALQCMRGRYTLAYTAPVSDGKRHKLHVGSTREGIHLIAPQKRFAVSTGDQRDSNP